MRWIRRDGPNRGIFLATAVLLCVAVGVARAQAPPTAFAVVDLQAAMVGTKDGKKAADELAAKVNPRKKDFEQRQAEVDRLRDQLREAKDDDRKAEIAADIDLKVKRLERDTQDAEDQLSAEEQKLADRLGPKLIATVNQYASEHGLAIIFDKSNAGSPVVFAAEEVDLTKAVIEAYDRAQTEAAPVATDTAAPAGTKPTPKAAPPKHP
jgi:outer membrane protein